jgi:hypothetical protein
MKKTLTTTTRRAIGALLCVTALSTGAAAFVAGHDRPPIEKGVSLILASPQEATPATDAAYRFVTGMTAGDEKAVWMFASEEDQAAFATEQAVYDAFAELYPALTEVDQIVVDDVRQEGETPFVDAVLRDDDRRYRAEIGLWLDDAGDWKVISLDVRPVGDLVAAR